MRNSWVSNRHANESQKDDQSYIVVARPNESIIAQIAANVCRDDLAVDAVAGNKIFVHSGSAACDRSAASISRLP